MGSGAVYCPRRGYLLQEETSQGVRADLLSKGDFIFPSLVKSLRDKFGKGKGKGMESSS